MYLSSISDDLRTITLQNLQDVVSLLNESSRDTSLSYQLDIVQFLALAQYWNFSYKHSLLSYVDDHPAAITLICTDEETLDAHTFYWGSLPAFRGTRLALNLFEGTCRRLLDDGYLRLSGEAVPERPLRRYRFVQAENARQMVDLEATQLLLPPAESPYEIRLLNTDVIAHTPLSPLETFHWSQRPSFLRRLSQNIEVLGAFSDGNIKAHAVIFPRYDSTTVIDIRSAGNDTAAGRWLLRSLLAQKCRAPFLAPYVCEDSYAHRLLTEAAFQVRRRFTGLTRDLRLSSVMP